jgi:ribosomal protein L37E
VRFNTNFTKKYFPNIQYTESEVFQKLQENTMFKCNQCGYSKFQAKVSVTTTIKNCKPSSDLPLLFGNIVRSSDVSILELTCERCGAALDLNSAPRTKVCAWCGEVLPEVYVQDGEDSYHMLCAEICEITGQMVNEMSNS